LPQEVRFLGLNAPNSISAGGAYSAPQTPYLDLRGLLLRGERGREREQGEKSEREGRGAKGREEM